MVRQDYQERGLEGTHRFPEDKVKIPPINYTIPGAIIIAGLVAIGPIIYVAVKTNEADTKRKDYQTLERLAAGEDGILSVTEQADLLGRLGHDPQSTPAKIIPYSDGLHISTEAFLPLDKQTLERVFQSYQTPDEQTLDGVLMHPKTTNSKR